MALRLSALGCTHIAADAWFLGEGRGRRENRESKTMLFHPRLENKQWLRIGTLVEPLGETAVPYCNGGSFAGSCRSQAAHRIHRLRQFPFFEPEQDSRSLNGGCDKKRWDLTPVRDLPCCGATSASAVLRGGLRNSQLPQSSQFREFVRMRFVR